MTKSQISSESYNRQLKAIDDFDICEKLKIIKKSILVLHGLKDRLVLPQNSRVLANLIPDAKLVIFENSAHVPSVEERDKFVSHLMDLLK